MEAAASPLTFLLFPAVHSLAESFVEWALHPERTLEERHTTALFIEQRTRFTRKEFNWEKQQALAEARRGNPAYVPEIVEADLRAVAEELSQLHDWPTGLHNDRPIRDLSILRFLPNLTSFSLDNNAEVTDISPLLHCPRLETVSLSAQTIEDYRPLAGCPGLKSIRIYTRFPWPRMEGWERLEQLEELYWNGPGTGFLSLSVLPRLQKLVLDTGGYHRGGAASLRDFHQLPDMPRLRHLWAATFYYLDGIERFSALTALWISGPFRSAAPATALPNLLFLHLITDELREVKSLAASPSMQLLVVAGERPLDYSALTDTPQLREALSFGCTTPQLELGALQATLPGWDDLYLAPVPRPLLSLSLIRPKEGQNVVDPRELLPSNPTPAAEMDWCRHRTSALWMHRRLRHALDSAGLTADIGVCMGYGAKRVFTKAYTYTADPTHSSYGLEVRLIGVRALGQFRKVVHTLRTLLVSLKDKTVLHISGKPDPDDDDYDREWIPSPDEEIREEHYRQEQLRKKRDYLAREFRLQLLKDEGLNPDPKDFAPPPPPAPKKPAAPPSPPEPAVPDDPPAIPFDPPNLDWDQRPPDAEAPGGIKDADPDNSDETDEHWLKPPPHLEPNVFWKGLDLYIFLTENSLSTNRDNAEIIEYLLSRE